MLTRDQASLLEKESWFKHWYDCVYSHLTDTYKDVKGAGEFISTLLHQLHLSDHSTNEYLGGVERRHSRILAGKGF